MKNEIIKKQSRLISLLFVLLFFIILISVGGFFNKLVVSQNGGIMPVLSDESYKTFTHFGYKDPSEIEYPFLSDIFTIGNAIFSIGDFFIIFGFISLLVTCILIIHCNHQLKKLKKHYDKNFSLYNSP